MSFNPAKGPCKGCPKRKPACHAHCPEYKDWKTQLDETRQREQAENRSWSLAGYARHTQYLKKYKRIRL